MVAVAAAAAATAAAGVAAATAGAVVGVTVAGAAAAAATATGTDPDRTDDATPPVGSAGGFSFSHPNGPGREVRGRIGRGSLVRPAGRVRIAPCHRPHAGATPRTVDSRA